MLKSFLRVVANYVKFTMECKNGVEVDDTQLMIGTIK
jgi:hypothetical protein